MRRLTCDMVSRAERCMAFQPTVIGLNHLTLQGQHNG